MARSAGGPTFWPGVIVFVVTWNPDKADRWKGGRVGSRIPELSARLALDHMSGDND